MLNLPKNAQEVIDKIESAGFEAWAVGGCVRDLVIGRPLKDVDIASNASPEQLHMIFDHVIDTGIKHGTVTVRHNGESFEVTRFRIDGEYTDSRHPESVSFTSSINEDLARRDFTVNAMAYNSKRGLLDLYGGINDIENKVIRCVGQPDKRFNEDALRIMRCVRFSSQLGFSIEKNTFESALKNAALLRNISAERIQKELFLTLFGEDPDALIPLLDTNGLEILELSMTPETLMPLKDLKRDISTVFAAFLLLSGCDDSAEAAENLKCSKKIKDDVRAILYDFNFSLCKTELDVKRRMSAYKDNFFKILDIRKNVLNEDTSFVESVAERTVKNNEPYNISDLAINGTDLEELSITKKQVGAVLKLLCDIVRQSPEKNTKEYLMMLAKEYSIH